MAGAGLSNGGASDGIEQYARQGRGSLSGLRRYMRSNVREIAKIENRTSVRTYSRPLSLVCLMRDSQLITHNSDRLTRKEW